MQLIQITDTFCCFSAHFLSLFKLVSTDVLLTKNSWGDLHWAPTAWATSRSAADARKAAMKVWKVYIQLVSGVCCKLSQLVRAEPGRQTIFPDVQRMYSLGGNTILYAAGSLWTNFGAFLGPIFRCALTIPLPKSLNINSSTKFTRGCHRSVCCLYSLFDDFLLHLWTIFRGVLNPP